MHDPKFGWAYHFSIENQLKAEQLSRDLFYRIGYLAASMIGLN